MDVMHSILLHLILDYVLSLPHHLLFLSFMTKLLECLGSMHVYLMRIIMVCTVASSSGTPYFHGLSMCSSYHGYLLDALMMSVKAICRQTLFP